MKGKYTFDALKADMKRLQDIEREKKAIGFRVIPVDQLNSERKSIKERLRGHGLEITVQSHVYISLEDEDE